MQNEQINLFRAVRSLMALSKLTLEVVSEIRAAHDENLDKIGESLIEMEDFLKDKYNIDIELCHLAKHSEYLSEERYNKIRKVILDRANELKRDLEK